MMVQLVLAPNRARVAEDDAAPVNVESAVVGRVAALLERRLSWLEQLRVSRPVTPGSAALRRAQLLAADTPALEQRWYEAGGAAEITARANELARWLEADSSSVLARLRQCFGLSPAEQDALHVCLALELEPALAGLAARALSEPQARHASVALVRRLCGHRYDLILPKSGGLRSWCWLTVSPHDDAPRLRLDPHVLELLADSGALDPSLRTRARALPVVAALASWPIEELSQQVELAWRAGKCARVLLTGRRGSGRRSFAANLAGLLGSSALLVDSAGCPDAELPELCLRARRQAVLGGMGLVWSEPRAVASGTGDATGRAAVELVLGDDDAVLTPVEGVVDLTFRLPPLSIDERLRLWRQLLPTAATWPAAELSELAERYPLNVGEIAGIAEREPAGVAQAAEQARLASRSALGELAELLPCPFQRTDLVLPQALDEQLDDLLFEARERARFWEQPAARRLFPRGTALVALLTGAPGTGKTMAAQVVARELGLDLVRVDLAAAVSKYIGETAKNLRQVFRRAAEMHAVLLFDEADALFAKRTEVRDSHDRYANADTNYLLQLIEDFEGVALLSSNKKQNIDPAFTRRIRYLLDFPKPRTDERLRIWRALLAELAPGSLDLLQASLPGLAVGVELSGAQIKLALLAALFNARRDGQSLALRHVHQGLERELRKEGRALGARERERLERGST